MVGGVVGCGVIVMYIPVFFRFEVQLRLKSEHLIVLKLTKPFSGYHPISLYITTIKHKILTAPIRFFSVPFFEGQNNHWAYTARWGPWAQTGPMEVVWGPKFIKSSLEYPSNGNNANLKNLGRPHF